VQQLHSRLNSAHVPPRWTESRRDGSRLCPRLLSCSCSADCPLVCFPSWRLHCGFCQPWSSRLEPVRSSPVDPHNRRPDWCPLGRLGHLFPAPRASRRSVFARAIHALPAESAAARYILERVRCRRFRLEASFAQVCGPLFSCPCHSPLCSLPYPLRFAGSGGQGATRSEQRGLLVVSNRTEFRTSAPRTLMPGQRHSSDGQVMEGDDGLRRRASVIVLGGP